MTKTYDIVGVGNAIVDVLSKCSDEFLTENGIDKGVMNLIDTDRAADLYSKMDNTIEASGGSGANTIAGLASLGIKTGFIAKVKDDKLGHVFSSDIKAQGTYFETPMMGADHGDETARCLVMVTDDGERSMNTYLGVSTQLTAADIDADLVANSDWVYLEGYLFDSPENQGAFYEAIKSAKSNGGKVALSLSDPFCVDRHRAAFRDLVKSNVDLLFCNEHEAMSLYQTENLDDAIAQAASEVEILACTAGEDGAYVAKSGEVTHVPTEAVSVVDATGAGDSFAAGFMAGLVKDRSMEDCAKMGCIAAAEVISHMGARAKDDWKELFAAKGL